MVLLNPSFPSFNIIQNFISLVFNIIFHCPNVFQLLVHSLLILVKFCFNVLFLEGASQLFNIKRLSPFQKCLELSVFLNSQSFQKIRFQCFVNLIKLSLEFYFFWFSIVHRQKVWVKVITILSF